MLVAPINFYSSYGLVPIFEWVTVEPTTDSTTDATATPVTCEGTGLDTQPQPADTDTSPQMRLVFKGFEWRPTAAVATFPRPDWMDGLASGCNDPSDPSKHARIDEAARARKTALLSHHQPDPAGSPDVGPTTPDPTEST
jgi:hypothetical protein